MRQCSEYAGSHIPGIYNDTPRVCPRFHPYYDCVCGLSVDQGPSESSKPVPIPSLPLAHQAQVLLSLNRHTRDSIEKPIKRSIESVARAFARQNTPSTFACALLASFLENVLAEYDKIRRRSPRSHGSPVIRAADDIHSTIPPTHVDRPTSLAQDLDTGNVAPINVTDVSWTVFDASNATAVNEIPPQQQNDFATGNEVDTHTIRHSGPALPETTESWFQPTDNYAWTFADEDGWSAMFSEAGFAIDGGVFMPN